MDPLDRLYFRLREIVLEQHPGDAASGALTVADIYQRLVPYRAVRGDLGILELAQYEHALLRLLAGERAYASVDAPEARDEIRRELASPNPILGVYRDYAAVPVRLELDPAAAAERTEPLPAPPPAAPPATAPLPAPPPPEPHPAEEPGPAAAAATCHQCRKPLPAGEEVRFCPACGAAQVEVPCAECAASLRPGWSYCIRCGTARGGR